MLRRNHKSLPLTRWGGGRARPRRGHQQPPSECDPDFGRAAAPATIGGEVAPLKRKPGRTAAAPGALGGLSVRELGRRVYERSWQDGILDRAAELSYYFAFALVPTLLFLATLLGLLPTPDLMPHLMSYADRVLPGDAASLLKKTLGEVVSGASGGLLSVGVLAALLGASSGMLSIMKALNAAYGIADSRTWWRRRLIAITLTIDRKSTRLNSSHSQISYAVFCLKKKKTINSTSLPPHNEVD